MNMITGRLTILPCVFLLMLALFSCSESDDDNSESSSLEEVQHEIAEEAVEMVIVPIDKAKTAQDISDERNQRIKDEIEKQ